MVRIRESRYYDSVRSIWVTVFSRFGGKTGLNPSDITTVIVASITMA